MVGTLVGRVVHVGWMDGFGVIVEDEDEKEQIVYFQKRISHLQPEVVPHIVPLQVGQDLEHRPLRLVDSLPGQKIFAPAKFRVDQISDEQCNPATVLDSVIVSSQTVSHEFRGLGWGSGCSWRVFTMYL